MSRVNKADKLAIVHSLDECAMKECVLDIQLVHCPILRERQKENGPDDGRLRRAKCLVIIHSRALSEAQRTQQAL